MSNNYSSNSSNPNKNDKIKEIVNYYDQNGASATLKYINEQKNAFQQQMNNLSLAKNNVDGSNANVYETANNMANYNAASGNYQAALSATEKLKNIINQYNQNSVQASNANEIAEKHISSQLQAQGLGQVGSSQANYNAISNNYANQVGQLSKNLDANANAINNELSSTVANNNALAQEKVYQNQMLEAEENKIASEKKAEEEGLRAEAEAEERKQTKQFVLDYLTEFNNLEDLNNFWESNGYEEGDEEYEEVYGAYKRQATAIEANDIYNKLNNATSAIDVKGIYKEYEAKQNNFTPRQREEIEKVFTSKTINNLLSEESISNSFDINYAVGSDIFGTEYATKISYLKEEIEKQAKKGNYELYIDGGKKGFFYYFKGRIYPINKKEVPKNAKVFK